MPEGKNLSKRIYCSRPTGLTTDIKQLRERVLTAWAQESIYPRVRNLGRSWAQAMQVPLLGLDQITYSFDRRILQT